MATAVHVSTNSSEITVVSNLNEAYSSDGVPTLASKVELLKSLWSTLQSHKVQEAKIADRKLFFFSVCWCSSLQACPCHHFGMRCLICDSFGADALSSVSEQLGHEKGQKLAIFAFSLPLIHSVASAADDAWYWQKPDSILVQHIATTIIVCSS